MKTATRYLFDQYTRDQATLNGVASVVQKFTVAPRIQQKLESRIQETSAFLKLVNIVPVDEAQGARLVLGTTGPIASRTDTNTADRATRDAVAMEGHGYECMQTNYDTHICYETLDMWAKFPDFQLRLARAIQQRCALDRLMIGFNGTSAAATTNRTAAPQLQDVNKGWLQYLRENAAARVMTQGAAAGKVTVGAVGDYNTLDGLVYDATKTLLDPWHAGAADLVAIVGRGLLHSKLFPLLEQTAPTEMLAADIVRSQSKLGGIPAVAVPYMPDHSVLITSCSNLSIYYQAGARRRNVQDNPRQDRVETYESSNDAFMIEDLGKACLVENIELT